MQIYMGRYKGIVLVSKTGDKVKAGQLIAYSGSTGDSTGPTATSGLRWAVRSSTRLPTSASPRTSPTEPT